MTALAADRATAQRDGRDIRLPVAASTTIHAGALVVLNASGFAQPGDAVAATHVAIGRAEHAVDNSAGANGDTFVRIQRGIFRWANSGGADEVDATHIGSPCYIVDDQTVAATSDGGARSPAGLVVDVDTLGVWVDTGWSPVASAAGSLAAASNLSDLANAATARGNLGVDTLYLPATGVDLVGANTAVVRLPAPRAGAITGITTVLDDALTTGDATITAAIDGVGVTDGVVTIAQAGSAAGDVDTATPSALNAVTANEVITLTVGGTNDAAVTATVLVEITY